MKTVQKELEQGWIWPFYWIYGPEKFLSREVTSRIRKAVKSNDNGVLGWGQEVFEATETDVQALIDLSNSPSLGGGIQWMLIKDAHLLKNVEKLAELFGPRAKCSELNSVCVFISKDLDLRKKFSKALLEHAAVISCEEISEAQRPAWVEYLSQRRSGAGSTGALKLSSSLKQKLSLLEPWSLDRVDQELEKYSLSDHSEDIVLEGNPLPGGTDAFIEKFFQRSLQSLPYVSFFADHPDESLPLLGLMGWNVKHLALWMSSRERGGRSVPLNPYIEERLRRWSSHWRMEEILDLQRELCELDKSVKQSQLMPLGVWTDLVIRFCNR